MFKCIEIMSTVSDNNCLCKGYVYINVTHGTFYESPPCMYICGLCQPVPACPNDTLACDCYTTCNRRFISPIMCASCQSKFDYALHGNRFQNGVYHVISRDHLKRKRRENANAITAQRPQIPRPTLA